VSERTLKADQDLVFCSLDPTSLVRISALAPVGQLLLSEAQVKYLSLSLETELEQ
jgi:hypothetical protein